MGPRAGLDRCGKSSFPPGFDSRTVQPVASRYTDIKFVVLCNFGPRPRHKCSVRIAGVKMHEIIKSDSKNVGC
jgi:hypothetical protein